LLCANHYDDADDDDDNDDDDDDDDDDNDRNDGDCIRCCLHRDTLVVTLANYFTGIFAGFVVFSFMGFMAGTMNASVNDVVDSGTLYSRISTSFIAIMLRYST